MEPSILDEAKKAHEELVKLILNSKTEIRKDYFIGFYRYWAKIDATENALLKNY